MKKYKLYKDLPDLNAGAIFEWDESNNHYKCEKNVWVSPNQYHFFSKGSVEENSEFFEKVGKCDYEIMSVYVYDPVNGIDYKPSNGYKNGKFRWEDDINPKFDTINEIKAYQPDHVEVKIHSVKSTHTGQIFKIGDIVDYQVEGMWYKDFQTITGFEEVDGQIMIMVNGNEKYAFISDEVKVVDIRGFEVLSIKDIEDSIKWKKDGKGERQIHGSHTLEALINLVDMKISGNK